MDPEIKGIFATITRRGSLTVPRRDQGHTGFKLAGFIAVVCLSVNGGDRFSKPIELGKKARLMADRYQRYSMFRCPRSEIA